MRSRDRLELSLRRFLASTDRQRRRCRDDGRSRHAIDPVRVMGPVLIRIFIVDHVATNRCGPVIDGALVRVDQVIFINWRPNLGPRHT